MTQAERDRLVVLRTSKAKSWGMGAGATNPEGARWKGCVLHCWSPGASVGGYFSPAACSREFIAGSPAASVRGYL
jgi:hypothetical protein